MVRDGQAKAGAVTVAVEDAEAEAAAAAVAEAAAVTAAVTEAAAAAVTAAVAAAAADADTAAAAAAAPVNADALSTPGELLELVLAEHEARAAEAAALPSKIDGVIIGRLVAIDAAGHPRVHYRGCPSPDGIAARAMAALRECDVGREAALLFEGGDPAMPVVMGLMFQSDDARPVLSRTGAQATVDGERIVLSADREIVLQCGEASLTLTRAGKILIRGAYVSSRSSGVNRIQGGSVQIN